MPLLDDQESNNLKLISSNSAIVLRLALVAFIGIVSMWANREASKGFSISIVNEAGHDTFTGKQFQLFYVSNDEATRLVIKASEFIEDFLYLGRESSTKKPMNRMVLKLVKQNLTDNINMAGSSKDHHEYVLEISTSIIQGTHFRRTMLLALQQGVARIWLWDGQGNAPKHLVNGIVEYIVSNIGGSNSITSKKLDPLGLATSCWNHEDSRTVARFLDYCEHRQPGFIRRLNQAMKHDWHDGTLDDILGLPVQNLCTSYHEALRYNLSIV